MADGALRYNAAGQYGLKGLAVVGSQLLGLTGGGVIEVKQNTLPKGLLSGAFNFIEADAAANKLILASATTVHRFDVQTQQLTELATGFSSISAVSVAPNGNIAVTETGGSNRLTILNAQGTLIKQVSGLVNPKGIARDFSGNIIVANSRPAKLSRLSNGVLTSMDSVVPHSIDFINRDEANQTLYMTEIIEEYE